MKSVRAGSLPSSGRLPLGPFLWIPCEIRVPGPTFPTAWAPGLWSGSSLSRRALAPSGTVSPIEEPFVGLALRVGADRGVRSTFSVVVGGPPASSGTIPRLPDFRQLRLLAADYRRRTIARPFAAGVSSTSIHLILDAEDPWATSVFSLRFSRFCPGSSSRTSSRSVRSVGPSGLPTASVLGSGASVEYSSTYWPSGDSAVAMALS